MSQFKTAPVDMFTTLRPRLLIGGLLQDIKSMQASIRRFGLLSPIVVSRQEGRLVVVDGRKRLAAIKRLTLWAACRAPSSTFPMLRFKTPSRPEPNAGSHVEPRSLCDRVDMFREHQDVD